MSERNPNKGNPLGKNEPILRELYAEKTGKTPLTKAGNQAKEYIDWKRSKFKPMKQTVLKKFGECTRDIDSGVMSANDCYEGAYNKTIEQGSVYIAPAYRTKAKISKWDEKYDLKALEEAFKKKYGIK